MTREKSPRFHQIYLSIMLLLYNDISETTFRRVPEIHLCEIQPSSDPVLRP